MINPLKRTECTNWMAGDASKILSTSGREMLKTETYITKKSSIKMMPKKDHRVLTILNPSTSTSLTRYQLIVFVHVHAHRILWIQQRNPSKIFSTFSLKRKLFRKSESHLRLTVQILILNWKKKTQKKKQDKTKISHSVSCQFHFFLLHLNSDNDETNAKWTTQHNNSTIQRKVKVKWSKSKEIT